MTKGILKFPAIDDSDDIDGSVRMILVSFIIIRK